MSVARSVALIGDAGLMLILTARACADYLLGDRGVGGVWLWLQTLFLSTASSLGDHRVFLQSVIIGVLIAMSLGGHVAFERRPHRSNRSRR